MTDADELRALLAGLPPDRARQMAHDWAAAQRLREGCHSERCDATLRHPYPWARRVGEHDHWCYLPAEHDGDHRCGSGTCRTCWRHRDDD